MHKRQQWANNIYEYIEKIGLVWKQRKSIYDDFCLALQATENWTVILPM
jgi:hypothetical protein